jgi:REP element-mobilizing transposase RayT
MPRANRLSGHGGIFHVTQRCHNREFLLKFALDRDCYRARLRAHLPQAAVSGVGSGSALLAIAGGQPG